MEQVCLITGSTGIAAATAKEMAVRGWRVFIASLTEQNCRDLAQEIRPIQPEADYLALDLTEPSSAKGLVHACVSRFGRLDALYNVAGISGRKFGDGGPLECTDEGWEKVLSANAQTQFRMCQEAARQMLAQSPAEDGSRGVLLNMSSILAIDPMPSLFSATAYAASKGAIISLTRHLAAHFAPERIRVNAIAPGLVATRMSARASESPEIVARMQQKQPLADGLIAVEDVAAASAFLLSKESRAITGQVLVVDGGWSVS
ncbi:MAG: SDR family oxidoreductase [Verrucomicrobiota bacterium]